MGYFSYKYYSVNLATVMQTQLPDFTMPASTFMSVPFFVKNINPYGNKGGIIAKDQNYGDYYCASSGTFGGLRNTRGNQEISFLCTRPGYSGTYIKLDKNNPLFAELNSATVPITLQGDAELPTDWKDRVQTSPSMILPDDVYILKTPFTCNFSMTTMLIFSPSANRSYFYVNDEIIRPFAVLTRRKRDGTSDIIYFTLPCPTTIVKYDDRDFVYYDAHVLNPTDRVKIYPPSADYEVSTEFYNWIMTNRAVKNSFAKIYDDTGALLKAETTPQYKITQAQLTKTGTQATLKLTDDQFGTESTTWTYTPPASEREEFTGLSTNKQGHPNIPADGTIKYIRWEGEKKLYESYKAFVPPPTYPGVTLFQNSSDADHIEKELEQVAQLNATYREPVDILKPDITIEWDEGVFSANYCYIDRYKRYYYIDRAEEVRRGLVRLYLRVDPLMSHREKIYAQNAVVSRTSKINWTDALLIDDKLPVSSEREKLVYEFEGGAFDLDREPVEVPGKIYPFRSVANSVLLTAWDDTNTPDVST